MLTTSNLERCLLDIDQGVNLSAANFPCLKNLAMTNCFPKSSSQRRIKVNGPQLLSLRLRVSGFYEVQIFAPKLKFFSFHQDYFGFRGFFETSLPALDHADIELKPWTLSHMVGEDDDHYFKSLIQSLCNVKSLKLHQSAIKELNKRCEFLEQQQCNFSRLESLILQSEDVQPKVTDYFLKASPCKEPIYCTI